MGRDSPPGAGGPDAGLTPAPARGVDPAWLRLRGPADARARTTHAAALTAELTEHLVRRPPAESGVVRLVDVGAGMGAGAQWLRERLPMDQDWRLVDHDPDVLAGAAPTAEGWARGVVAGVDELPRLLADEPADVVTCQALLDVLTAGEVDTLLGAAMASDAALLLGLSVTGQVVLSPPHPDDGLVAEAFDAHQRRAGRLGPDGGGYAASVLRSHGYDATTAATPWHLAAADTALSRAWVHGRAAAALEQEPALGGRIDRWCRSRDEAARQGRLSVAVDHVDVLGLPTRVG